ncbi:lipopolysaccharide biosynthesis protein [Pseudalkalibacillus sp. Hm43]|uniref:lipopolysaccharide biosynthesis protein n=1 Tax=Pseudalkalibacillus sp. Hm43 TaxID=3450742 RepID=UPI003F425115
MLKHTLNYFLAKGLPGIINFVAIAVYTRMLEPKEYGEYALVLAAVTFVNASLFHWLKLGMLRFSARHNDTEKEQITFFSSIIATFLSMILLSVLLGTTGGFLFIQEPHLRYLWLLGLALLCTLSAFELLTEFVRAELRSKLYGVLTLIKVISSLAFSYLYIKLGLGGDAIILGLITGTSLAAIFILPRYIHRLKLNTIDRSLIKEVVMYGLPFIATLSMEYIILTSDRFLLNQFVGTNATGIYAVSYDLSKQILMLIMIIVNLAAYPLVVRALEKEGLEACQNQLRQNTTLLFMISLPAVAGLIILSQPIVEVFLGEAYREKGQVIFSLISIGIFIQGIKMFYFDLAFQLGKNTKLQIWPVLVASILNVVLNLFLIPKYQIYGAAYSTISAYLVSLILSALIGKKIFPLVFPWLNVLKIFIAVSAMSAILLFLEFENSIVTLIVKSAIGIIVFLISTYLLKIDEVMIAISKAKRILAKRI